MSANAESLGMDVVAYMQQVGERASSAARSMSYAETHKKNSALLAIAQAVEDSAQQLVQENQKDLDAGKQQGLDAAKISAVRDTGWPYAGTSWCYRDYLRVTAERNCRCGRALFKVGQCGNTPGRFGGATFQPGYSGVYSRRVSGRRIT
jgi:hypothetical protein